MRRGLALLATAIVATSCGGGATHTLTESDSLAEIAVDVGDVVELSLEENPGTGYTWELRDPPALLELTGDEYAAPDTDQVGAPGTRKLTFEVTSEDAGILRLEYVRPFDDPPVPDRVVEYIIVAGGATWPPEPGAPPSTSTATAP